jgi:transposase
MTGSAEPANMILLAAEGKTDREIASQSHVGRRTPARWRLRLIEQRLAGTERDAPRPGRKPQARPRVV